MRKIALFVDGYGATLAARSHNFGIDYSALVAWATSAPLGPQSMSDGRPLPGMIVRAQYYALLDEELAVQNVRRVLDWLDYNGWVTITKTKRPGATVNVDMAVDMIALAGRVTEIVLLANSAEFCAAVEAVQRLGTRVIVVSTVNDAGSFCVADDLRRQADHFVDLRQVAGAICKPLPPPAAATNKHASST